MKQIIFLTMIQFTITTGLLAGIPQGSADMKPIVNAYVQMENALASDNPAGAAKAAESLKAAFNNLNVSKQSADLKKTFEDIKSDAVENAEHISESGKNIAHQREHFDLLSKDVYDLVKKFGTGQVLYKIFCPMYNNGKGAYWISETKEIRNPYLGKSMSTCGTVSEELKP